MNKLLLVCLSIVFLAYNSQAESTKNQEELNRVFKQSSTSMKASKKKRKKKKLKKKKSVKKHKKKRSLKKNRKKANRKSRSSAKTPNKKTLRKIVDQGERARKSKEREVRKFLASLGYK